MPGGDRTGPMGAGPMTGRGAGYCAGATGISSAGQMFRGNLGAGRGRGGGPMGGGRGRRNQYWATGLPGWARRGDERFGPVAPARFAPSSANTTSVGDVEYLRQQAQYLRRELEAIESRLEELQPGDRQDNQADKEK